MVGSANGLAPHRRQTITCTFDNQVHLSTYVSQGVPYYCYGSTLISAWISNHTPSKVWNKITYPFPNFNGATIEVWEWMNNFIPYFIRDAITYPCWGESQNHVSKIFPGLNDKIDVLFAHKQLAKMFYIDAFVTHTTWIYHWTFRTSLCKVPSPMPASLPR